MIQPTKWSVPLGSGADVQELPNDDLKFASFSKIFPQITQVPLSAGGVAPRRIDFNSLFKLLADNIYFYQNGGVFEYSDTADYEKGALVRYNDKIYLCIQDNSALNTHNPEDMDYWLRVALNNELSDYLPLAGGNVTGNLTVQNKNVVCSVNDVNADAEGNVSDIVESGSNYIRYANGVQICWGVIQKYTITWSDHELDYTLPKPFKDTNYTVQTTAKGVGEDFIHVEVKPTNNSYFHCSFIPLVTYSNGTVKAIWGDFPNPFDSLYLAVGYWK